MYPQDFDEAAYVFDVESVMLGREHRTEEKKLPGYKFGSAVWTALGASFAGN